MSELQDIRGAQIGWIISGERPLLCFVSLGDQRAGSLVQADRKAPIRAHLAGVWWHIESQKDGDRLSFDGGRTQIAVGQESFLRDYKVLIDETTLYGLQAVPQKGRAIWIDDAGHQAVIFRRQFPKGNQSGEIIVSRSIPLEHAPILVILGLIRIGQKRLLDT